MIWTGGFLLLCAAALLVGDVVAASDGAFRLRPIGQLWFELHRESLLLAQPAIERHLHKDLWFGVVDPVLRTPAVWVAAGLGALFLCLGLWRRTRRRARGV